MTDTTTAETWAWTAPWSKPTKASEALRAALHIIRDEQRWCAGELMRRKIGAAEPPSCTNVKVCAMGALILVCFDGPAVQLFFYAEERGYGSMREDPHPELGDGNDYELLGALRRHPVGKRALAYLELVLNKRRRVPISTPTALGEAEAKVIQFNDESEDMNTTAEQEAHLARVAQAFEDAAVAAEARGE